MTTVIEKKIRKRAYHSPSRARAAVSRSHLGKKDKERLGTLIDRWENEGTVDHVVAGLPAPAVEVVETVETVETVDAGPSATLGSGQTPAAHLSTPLELSRPAVGRLSLNALVRVRLTLQGLSLLHAARDRVRVPDDILARQGVWEITLWELMSVFGSALSVGDAPIDNCLIEVLDPKVSLPAATKAPS